MWADITGNRIVDIRRVQSQGQAAHYVSKYLSKALTCPYGMKRYRMSRQYSEAPPHTSLKDLLGIEAFEYFTTDWQSAGAEFSAAGFRVELLMPELLICRPP